MKQVRNIFVRLVLFSVCSVFFLSNSAQSFQDDFDELNEKYWEYQKSEFAIWRAENGLLKVWINSPHDGRWGTKLTIEDLIFKDPRGADRELIQKNGRNPGYENFTITVKNIAAKGIAFGIDLGSRIPVGDKERWSGYSFFTSQISVPSDQRHNFSKTWWGTSELASMEIRFNRGHFQWFADGEKRVAFEDPRFSSIEELRFIVFASGLGPGHGWVDSFKITGLVLSVSPQAKLATRWAKLKQH